MSVKRRRVRSLVLRNYVASAITSFIVFALMIVMFGFDLEDQIFDNQVKLKADQLEADFATLESSAETGGVPMTYYIGTDDMPAWLKVHIDPAWPGIVHEDIMRDTYEIFAEEKGHFHLAVREVGEQKLYLIFNARPYIRSTPQIKSYLGIIAGMAGIAMLVSLFFMYRMTKRVSVPLENMAATLAEGHAPDAAAELSDGDLVELQSLAAAIQTRDSRIQGLLERERQFNRDASHELRTPLAVAMGAAEVMEEKGVEGRSFTRLKTSLTDMQHLTEGILWLSRDARDTEACDPEQIGREAVEAYKHLLQDRPVETELVARSAVSMPVPKAVAQVMIGNLIRNAFSYTDTGKITIASEECAVIVDDTGVGFGNADEERSGFGIGLSLVERLCQHFGLVFDVSAAPGGVGTRAKISWKIK